MTDLQPRSAEQRSLQNQGALVGPANANYAVATNPQDIRDTIVIKADDLFLLTDLNGNVPRGNPNGLGLYYQDTRFLSGYELILQGIPPTFLLSTGEMRFAEIQELTNPDLSLPQGETILKETITFHRERAITPFTVEESLEIRNFNPTDVPLQLVIGFDADFADMFQVRGFVQVHDRGTLHPPRWNANELTLAYDGIDGITRRTRIVFSPSPSETREGEALYLINLGPRGTTTLQLTVSVELSNAPAPQARPAEVPLASRIDASKASYAQWMTRQPSIETDNAIFNDLIQQSRLDLRLLRSGTEAEPYPAAGIPWFATLFGRDSLITAYQNLWDPQLAASLLRLLGSLQGSKVDLWRDETPGKIPHELRRGELAHCNIVPFNPYYGTVDATPLYVMLLAAHYRETGDLGLVRELEPNLRRALEWMETYGDPDGDGFLEYERKSGSGLDNQGWKDSWDAIMYKNGDLIHPPVALVEVQAYAYAARLGASELYRALGNPSEASRQTYVASWLKDAFNEKFWMEDEGCYCLALDGEKRQADVISSNPGHALWCGIAPPERAKRVAERLMRPDVFTGWAIRTLATGEVRYNPMGYHVGTVWPHDNSIFAMGLKRYGEEARLRDLITGFFDAGRHFPDLRMPELFCGYDRAQYQVPVRYPVACSPQAWAAAASLLFVRAILGLQPQAPRDELWIVRPELPAWLRFVTIRGIRVGKGTVDLRYQRQGEHTFTEVLAINGDVRVVFVDQFDG